MPGIISRLYNHLTSPPASLPSYTAQWSKDLQIELDVEDWVNVWTNTKSSSHNIVALEANYKVLMRWYLVPARISKFLPNYSPLCFRGCGERGTHLHIWWSCPLVKQFWTIIFRVVSTLLRDTLDPDPSLVLLNHVQGDYTRAQLRLLLQFTTAAKQTIARSWKTPKLTIAEVKNRVTQAMIHSKIEATILDRIPPHHKTWAPWVEHFLLPNFDSHLLEP